jgi:hypothetical protein
MGEIRNLKWEKNCNASYLSPTGIVISVEDDWAIEEVERNTNKVFSIDSHLITHDCTVGIVFICMLVITDVDIKEVFSSRRTLTHWMKTSMKDTNYGVLSLLHLLDVYLEYLRVQSARERMHFRYDLFFSNLWMQRCRCLSI